jgi:hypothetical protein
MPDDPRRTSKFALIELHYERLSDDLRWNNTRYRRLCSALKLTEWELGAFIRCRISEIARWLRSDQYPATVELHLTLIEQTVFPTSKPPPFPPVE